MSINNGAVPVPVVAKPLSVYDIAEEMGYTPAGVHKAIERLSILPEQVTPAGVRYFSPLIIEKLREHMRRSPGNDE